MTTSEQWEAGHRPSPWRQVYRLAREALRLVDGPTSNPRRWPQVVEEDPLTVAEMKREQR